MKFKQFTKICNLNYDLINIFTDYALELEDFFKYSDNIEKHRELYIKYINLDKQIKECMKKYEL